MIKKIISLLLASVICFGGFGALAVTAQTPVITAAISSFDFAVKSAEMVKDDTDSMLRIIGKLKKPSVEFVFPVAADSALSESGMFVLSFESESDLLAALDALERDGNVLFAERDVPVYTESLEQAEGYLSWGPEAIEADIYAQASAPQREITVAVIDSGAKDIDFLKNKLVDGYDFYDNDADAANDVSKDSHGTFLASIVADCTGNMPVKIMPVRVLESKTGSLINVINGINYAVDNGAHVINLSLCAPLINCKSLEAAVAYAEKNNVTFVTCAGNNKADTETYCPSHCETAITVSAVDEQGEFCAEFSNYGSEIYLAAPGKGIISYNAAGELTALNGTSMSAAFVSAAAAMFLSNNPNCNTNQVRAALKKCAQDLGLEGKDTWYGWGMPKLGKLAEDNTVYVEDIRFDEENLTVKAGNTLTVEPVVYPANATDKGYVLSTDSNAISINGNVITALKPGTATLTAVSKDGFYTATATITVYLPEISIKNNTGARTISYGETLRLSAETKNATADMRIFWYVDGVKLGEGTSFEVSPESGVTVTVKLVDSNKKPVTDADGKEISDSQTVNVKNGFLQKLISFFKNLFGISRIVIQSIKYI